MEMTFLLWNSYKKESIVESIMHLGLPHSTTVSAYVRQLLGVFEAANPLLVVCSLEYCYSGEGCGREPLHQLPSHTVIRSHFRSFFLLIRPPPPPSSHSQGVRRSELGVNNPRLYGLCLLVHQNEDQRNHTVAQFGKGDQFNWWSSINWWWSTV